MLHGKGKMGYSDNSQLWLTKSYYEKRNRGLLDRDKLTEDEQLIYEISGSQGGGRTDPSTYEVKQHPFPDTGKKTIDIREMDPAIGD